MSLGEPLGHVVDASKREVVDLKRQAAAGIDPEGQGQGGANAAAVGDGDDIAAGVAAGQTLDHGRDAPQHLGQAFPPGR